MNKVISLVIFVIYPMLGASFAAAFLPLIIGSMLIFWLGMIYGVAGILAAIHVKALSMKPISTGLILGGLATILGIQGLHLMDTDAIHMFFSLLMTLGLIIYLAYKKMNKTDKTNGRDV